MQEPYTQFLVLFMVFMVQLTAFFIIAWLVALMIAPPMRAIMRGMRGLMNQVRTK